MSAQRPAACRIAETSDQAVGFLEGLLSDRELLPPDLIVFTPDVDETGIRRVADLILSRVEFRTVRLAFATAETPPVTVITQYAEADIVVADDDQSESATSSVRARLPSVVPERPAFQDLVEAVRQTARRIGRSLPPSVREDAESAAMVGLMEAMRHFGEMDEGHFQAYLNLRVRGAIHDEARRLDHLSQRTRKLVRSVDQVTEDYRKQHGRSPDMDHVAEVLGIDEDVCWQALELKHFDSLPIDDDTLATERHTAEDFFVESYAATALRWALNKLNKRSRLVLRLWYKRGLSAPVIARRLRVSSGRAHQIRVEAEKQLAHWLERSPPMAEMKSIQSPPDWDEFTEDTLRSATRGGSSLARKRSR